MEKKWYPYILYILVALYLINKTFLLITIPDFILNQEKWIFLAGAILLLWGGYRYYSSKEE